MEGQHRECDGWGRKTSGRISPEASSRRDFDVRECARRGCTWCFCLSLLAGGFIPRSLEVFSDEEAATLAEQGSVLRQERLTWLDGRRRLPQNRGDFKPTQGRFE